MTERENKDGGGDLPNELRQWRDAVNVVEESGRSNEEGAREECEHCTVQLRDHEGEDEARHDCSHAHARHNILVNLPLTRESTAVRPKE